MSNSIHDMLEYTWKVYDTSSIKMKPVYQNYSNITVKNKKRPVANVEGLYSFEVQVHNKYFTKPNFPNILKAEGIVNVRKDPHWIWEDRNYINPNFPEPRESFSIRILEIDFLPDQILYLKKGDTKKIRAAVTVWTYRSAGAFLERDKEYTGKVLNPSIEWGYLNENLIGGTQKGGKLGLIKEYNGWTIEIEALKVGTTYLTATYRDHTTKRMVIITE
jgi:hypothetical protein